jgi:hypothetical protein
MGFTNQQSGMAYTGRQLLFMSSIGLGTRVATRSTRFIHGRWQTLNTEVSTETWHINDA